jgi:formylglycine-generating enzyme required for sulfatase activity
MLGIFGFAPAVSSAEPGKPVADGAAATSREETAQSRAIAALEIEMVVIPAGTFTKGSPGTETDRDGDETQTQVTISQPFSLGKYEVTQAEWMTVMGTIPSHHRGDRFPVEQVGWDEALVFCQRLTAAKRAAGKLTEGQIYTLPTEAQWEYACRAGSAGAFAGTGKMDDMGWYSENSGRTTHPVGKKQPNAWGLYDMHGNVSEWCADWYGGDYDGVKVTDPTGAETGSSRVFRGGSWLNPAGNCRAAYRSNGMPANRRSNTLGFRVALSTGAWPTP